VKYLSFFVSICMFLTVNLYAKNYTVIQRTIVNKNFSKEEKLHFIRSLLRQEDNKKEINFIDKHGYTALDLAVIHNYPSIVETLLKNGANPNIKDKKGYTPLHRAVIKLSPKLTQLLMEYKADPDIKDIYGYTALERAFLYEDVDLAYTIGEILLKNGANPFVTDKRGRTLFEKLASEKGERKKLLELLIKYMNK